VAKALHERLADLRARFGIRGRAGPCPSPPYAGKMKTTARLTHESFRFDQPVQTHLVVSLLAPPLEQQATRPPVCVIPVIDISGSMDGPKLHQARQSVMKLIDHLGPRDRCGVVVFSGGVEVVSLPVEMATAAKALLKLQVGDLHAHGNTNLSGGMLAGLELGNLAALPEGMLIRVILFTDGHANAGVATASDQLLPLLDAHLGRVTLSAFGYGQDADQELLSDLARRGAGNYAFVATPDDASSAFARELGGLLSTFATGIEVCVTPAPGVRLLSVLSDVDAVEENGSLVLRVDDLLAEEERHLVLQVELPACPEPATLPAFQVSGSYARRSGRAMRKETLAHSVQVDRVERPLAQAHPDPLLDGIVAQAQLLRAQLDAEAQARRGDYQGAVTTLYQVARSLDARGHGEVASAARAMSVKVRDARSFEGSASHRKSMQAGLRRGSASSLEGEARMRLRQMGRKVATRAQEDMDDSFGRPQDRPDSGSPAATRGVTRKRSKRW
jgi:Ca-activated chloride channel family protein